MSEVPTKRVIGRPFPKGQSGNPRGRPIGAKSKLVTSFFQDMLQAWEQHGQAALQKAAVQDPVQFCKIVASLAPREISLDHEIRLDALEFGTEIRAAIARVSKTTPTSAGTTMKVITGKVLNGRNT